MIEIRKENADLIEVELFGGIHPTDGELLGPTLRANPKASVTIEINSPGGSLHGALAMYDSLRAHGGKVETRNGGKAASAAGVVFLAGSSRVASPNSDWMGHRPSYTHNSGDSEQLRRQAERLDKEWSRLQLLYGNLTLSSGQRALLADDELWLDSAEQLKAGVATKVAEVEVSANANKPTLQRKLEMVIGRIAPEDATPEMVAFWKNRAWELVPAFPKHTVAELVSMSARESIPKELLAEANLNAGKSRAEIGESWTSLLNQQVS